MTFVASLFDRPKAPWLVQGGFFSIREAWNWLQSYIPDSQVRRIDCEYEIRTDDGQSVATGVWPMLTSFEEESPELSVGVTEVNFIPEEYREAVRAGVRDYVQRFIFDKSQFEMTLEHYFEKHPFVLRAFQMMLDGVLVYAEDPVQEWLDTTAWIQAKIKCIEPGMWFNYIWYALLKGAGGALDKLPIGKFNREPVERITEMFSETFDGKRFSKADWLANAQSARQASQYVKGVPGYAYSLAAAAAELYVSRSAAPTIATLELVDEILLAGRVLKGSLDISVPFNQRWSLMIRELVDVLYYELPYSLGLETNEVPQFNQINQ